MATPKPPKRGSPAEPPNPRAEPGCFLVRGKAWFDEHGNMVIDEDGNVPGWIVDNEDLEQFGDCLYDETHFRNDGTPRAGAESVLRVEMVPGPGEAEGKSQIKEAVKFFNAPFRQYRISRLAQIRTPCSTRRRCQPSRSWRKRRFSIASFGLRAPPSSHSSILCATTCMRDARTLYFDREMGGRSRCTFVVAKRFQGEYSGLIERLGSDFDGVLNSIRIAERNGAYLPGAHGRQNSIFVFCSPLPLCVASTSLRTATGEQPSV